MTPFGWLLVLALTDAMFAGYRSAAGRNPRLHKADYYLGAFWMGLFGGAANCLLVGSIGVGLAAYQVHTGQSWADAWQQLEAAAGQLVRVYAIFASVLLAVMLLWTYPRRESRELSVVMILGPCTLLRGPWIIIGAGYAALQGPTWTGAWCLTAAISQLLLEWVLNRLQASAQRRRMAQW